jgi:hypothetical protein
LKGDIAPVVGFFVMSTTGLRIPGTAAEAMMALQMTEEREEREKGGRH